MSLSTHVLDTALGRPAPGIPLLLWKLRGANWIETGSGRTDPEGRCKTLLGDSPLEAATYKLRFDTAPYFAAQQLTSLYPYVEIVFTVADAAQHHHIPLLLAPHGYTTYRGS